MKCAGFSYYLGMNGYFRTSDGQDIVLPELESLYEPEPVVFSFETPAWYVLWGLVLIALIFGLWKWYRGYRSREYRRIAVKNIGGIQLTDSAENSALSTIQITLKQVAMSTYGRPMVAALFGKEWLQFLERTGKHTPFTQYELLIGTNSEVSKKQNASQIGALRDMAKKWIITHA
jgi:hypothetical protein